NVEQLIEMIAKANQPDTLKDLRIARRILNEVNGEQGSKVKITFLDGKDMVQQTVITREKLEGEISPRFGNFPPQYTEFESKRLDGNIGYIRFNVFTLPIVEKVNIPDIAVEPNI